MVALTFDDLKYTRAKVRRQAEMIQEHTSDGSVFEGCDCIPAKHMDMQAEYAAEWVAIATNPKEKEFALWLSQWSNNTLDHIQGVLDHGNSEDEQKLWMELGSDEREIRHEVYSENFGIPNPASKRAYLPHGLTFKEKGSKSLRETLSRCINEVEQRCCEGHSQILYPDGKTDYSQCSCNPVAVCRSSVEK